MKISSNPLAKLQCACAAYIESCSHETGEGWDAFETALEEYFAVIEEKASQCNPFEAACIKFIEAGAQMFGELAGEGSQASEKWTEAVEYFHQLKSV